MRYLVSVAALLMAGSAVAANNDSSSTAGNDDQKMVCKNMGETGSRLGGKKVCKTKAQWADEKAQLRNAIDRGQTGNGLKSQ